MLKRTSSGMALRLAGVLFVMMTALYLSSCCDSCPTLPGDPPPYKGWLYANNSTNCYLYRIDSETDSLIDSIQYEMQGNEDYEAGHVAASPDGRYLADSYVDNLAEQYLMRIHDARTMQTIVDLPGPIIPICFLPENDILLTHKQIGLTMDMVLEFYRVPDFVKVAEDTVPNLGQCFKLDLALDQNRHLIYFWIEIKREVGESERDSMVLAAYDYREREFKQEWTIDMRLQKGEFYIVSRSSLDLRRMRLFALCG